MTMLNIRIEDGSTHVDCEGTKNDLIIECGFAVYACVDVLRNGLGKSDHFIKDVFDIALNHRDGEQDD